MCISWTNWQFILTFASQAAPLMDLTKKSAPIQVKWNDHLQSPDSEKLLTLQMDALGRGLGAVLSQRDDSTRSSSGLL